MDKKLQKRIILVAGALEKVAATALERSRDSYNKHNENVDSIINEAIDARVQGADPKVLNKLSKKLLKAKDNKEKALGRLVDQMVKPSKAKKASVKKQSDLKNPQIMHGTYANDLYALLQANFLKPSNDISWKEVVKTIMKLNNDHYGLHNGYYDKLEKLYHEKNKNASVKKTAELEIKLKKFPWTQIGGDIDPGSHGGILATSDGSSIELLNIQPTRDSVGDSEALEVGFPFWTTEAYYDLSDLDLSKSSSALSSSGITEDDFEKMSPEERGVAIAEALLYYGKGVDPGPAGWSKDVVPGKVKWWGSNTPKGPEYLADADEEFRQLLEEQND